ncbi:hypothetical protein B0H13DRAFT_1866949 [Mycena leptocephala]|nr:hypothetical protein B0H13DRAFT_1866949 [Mycena leptocephala]
MSFSPTTLEPITSVLNKGNGAGGGLVRLIPPILDPVTSTFDPITSIPGSKGLPGGGNNLPGGGNKGQLSSSPVSSPSSATMGVASSSSQASPTASPPSVYFTNVGILHQRAWINLIVPRRESPKQSSTSTSASTSASTSIPITSGLTSGTASTPTSSAHASVSIQPQQSPVAGIHRDALTAGAIGGVSVAIVAVVIAIILLVIRLRRRRRDRCDTNVEARMVSPFVHLPSGTPVGSPEIAADSPGARLRYLEKEIRTTRARMVEIDARTRVREQPAEPPALVADVAAVESSSNGPSTTESDGEVAALRARIGELETQMRGAWALGLSDDPPPGYTA